MMMMCCCCHINTDYFSCYCYCYSSRCMVHSAILLSYVYIIMRLFYQTTQKNHKHLNHPTCKKREKHTRMTPAPPPPPVAQCRCKKHLSCGPPQWSKGCPHLVGYMYTILVRIARISTAYTTKSVNESIYLKHTFNSKYQAVFYAT